MKALMIKLMELKEKEREIKEERVILEGEIYTQVESKLIDDNTFTLVADEYKLTVKPNFSLSIDQDYAKKYPDVFKVKYDLSYSQYKKIQDKSELDEHVTIKILKPTFNVEIK